MPFGWCSGTPSYVPNFLLQHIFVIFRLILKLFSSSPHVPGHCSQRTFRRTAAQTTCSHMRNDGVAGPEKSVIISFYGLVPSEPGFPFRPFSTSLFQRYHYPTNCSNSFFLKLFPGATRRVILRCLSCSEVEARDSASRVRAGRWQRRRRQLEAL